MSVIVLFDDERTFVEGFRNNVLIVRTSEEAVELFQSLPAIHELWLDYVLVSDDTTTALHALKNTKVEKVFFHSTAWSAKGLVEYHLQKAGVNVPVEIPETQNIFVKN